MCWQVGISHLFTLPVVACTCISVSIKGLDNNWHYWFIIEVVNGEENVNHLVVSASWIWDIFVFSPSLFTISTCLKRAIPSYFKSYTHKKCLYLVCHSNYTCCGRFFFYEKTFSIWIDKGVSASQGYKNHVDGTFWALVMTKMYWLCIVRKHKKLIFTDSGSPVSELTVVLIDAYCTNQVTKNLKKKKIGFWSVDRTNHAMRRWYLVLWELVSVSRWVMFCVVWSSKPVRACRAGQMAVHLSAHPACDRKRLPVARMWSVSAPRPHRPLIRPAACQETSDQRAFMHFFPSVCSHSYF